MVRALDGVDLEIASGELVVIVGPSGSGKTSMLNLLGGIDSPDEGTLHVAGHQLSALDANGRTAYRRDVVGFVFQSFNLIQSLSARENVELVLELIGKKSSGRAEEVLEAVGLADRMDHFPAQLSGGEQQRVTIARAVAKNPRLLLCDEPTGALDVATGRSVLALLHRYNRDTGCTVVLVTHNTAICAMADRIVHMHSGRVDRGERNASPMPAENLSW
jgi:putative ABC transport system ATP-binding protein